MERVKFIQHKGKVILLINCAGCSAEEVLPVIREAKAAIGTQRAGSVRALTDVTGACFDSAVSEAMKDLVLHNKPYVAASAIVGVIGLKQIIFRTVIRFSGRHIHSFETLSEAMDWLAAQ